MPTLNDDIHELIDNSVQRRLLQNLSEAPFLGDLWYRFSGGDYFVTSLRELSSGNWLMGHEWELKISSIWVSKTASNQNEYILLKTEPLPPYKINSDPGGESRYVGILDDTIVISENEVSNGYAIIGGKTIDLQNRNVITCLREKQSHWIFLATNFHKIGYNAEEVIAFCKQLDENKIEVNASNLRHFTYNLRNHPTVLKYN